MKSYLSVPILLILVACQPFSAYAADENIPQMTVEQVLERYIQAVGGEEALLSLQTRIIRGQVTNDLPGYKPPVFEKLSIEAYSKMPDSRLFVEYRSDGPERDGFDGQTEWEEIRGKVTVSEESRNRKMSWIQNPQNALKFEEYFPNLSYGGTTELRGHLCHKLIPETLDPLYYSLYFSVESGLLVSLGFYWELHDWKEVDGVLIPHKIIAGRKGGSTTYHFNEVFHNQELDNKIFAMPEMEE